MTPRTPTTAAGRALLARLSLDVPWFIAGSVAAETDLIIAIEAEARAPLDVGRLARALHNVSYGCEYPSRPSRADAIYHRGHAAAIAREYAALEEPTE